MKDCQSVSLWMKSAQPPQKPALEEDKRTDVCIVGAGITGLMCAYLLMRDGVSSIVLDDGPIGGGETQRTSAHLSGVFDCGFAEMERLHGPKKTALAAQSHRAAVDLYEAISRYEQIDCGFERVNGYLFADEGGDGLQREFDAARRAGAGPEWAGRIPLDTYNPGRAVRFPLQAQFYPLRFLAGLAVALERGGCQIFSSSRATGIEEGKFQVVRTAKHHVRCRGVIVATNSPFNNMFVPHTKQAAYRTFMLGFRMLKSPSETALYWDTADPYHYARFAAAEGGGDILLVGGEDHKTGQAHDADERFMRLENWTRRRFPSAGVIEYRWSGQVLETIDHLAFIGRNPESKGSVFIATGDCGMGLTHGAVASALLRDLVLGRNSPWKKLYDPSRKPLKAVRNFLKENVNTAARYFDWLTDGDVRFVDGIAPGHGAVLRSGLTKTAVYRDEEGAVHMRSAVCPHMHCIVDWNPAEKTWDCPCHGSRFDCRGKLLNGPANVDLPPAREEHTPKEDNHGVQAA